MTIAMDDIDVAFLAATGAPPWQPLGDEATTDWAQTATADDGWTEILLQLELDRAWDEISALLATSR